MWPRLTQMLEIILFLYVAYLLVYKLNTHRYQQQRTASETVRAANDLQNNQPPNHAHSPIQESADGSKEKTVVV